MRFLQPIWLCMVLICLHTCSGFSDVSLNLVATAPYLNPGSLTINPCVKINCTSYNVTQFDVNIIWNTEGMHQPFSALTTAYRLFNTSDMLIVNDDIDFLVDQAQRLRIPESPIIRFPRQRNPQKWREQQGLPPKLESTSNNEDRSVDILSKIDRFEFCDSQEAMVTGERKMLNDIFQNLGWKRLIIICDKFTEIVTMKLSDDLSAMGMTLIILTVNTTSSTFMPYPGLKQTYDLHNGEDLDVLLICSLGCVRMILNEANTFDLEQNNKTSIRHSSRWLISNYGYDEDYLETSGLTLDNVAALTGPSYHECYPTSVQQVLPHVVDAALDIIDITPDYSQPINHYLKTEIISILKNPTVKWQPCVGTLLWKDGERREMNNVDNGPNNDDFSNIFPNTKFGFNQRLFQVATLEWSPFVIKKVTNGTAEYSGLCVDLLRELASSLNFTYKMVEPPDGEWGRYHNNEWTGLIGQVAKHESDMILAAVTVSNEREAVMDFTFPYYFGYSVVFFRKPDPNVDKWYTLLAPFKWEVLVCIFSSVLCLGLLIFITEKHNPFYSVFMPKRKVTSAQRTLWYLYGALLNHGGHTMPFSASGRMFISTWWLFCMVSAATYSGNLIAFLTVGTKKVPFNTLAEMVESEDYSWGYLQGSFLETLFKNSNLPTYQKVWKGVQEFSEKNPDHLHPDMDVHFNRMMNTPYAVIDDGSAIFSWSEHQCDIQILNERFFPNHYALGLPNNSPFTSIFSNQMIKIYESGLLQIWQQNWWPKTKFCSGSLTTQSEPIDLLSLQSAFYVLAIGVFLALLTLFCEYIRKRVYRKRQEKMPKALAVAQPLGLSEGF